MARTEEWSMVEEEWISYYLYPDDDGTFRVRGGGRLVAGGRKCTLDALG